MKGGEEETQDPMPAAKMTETLQLPSLQVPEPQVVQRGHAWSSSSTPTLRRRRFKLRRTRNAEEQNPGTVTSSSKEFLQLPSIEITPSSDEDTPWSNCSTPSASPRRKRFLLRKWLNVREKKECSESSSQHSSHDDDPRLLSPRLRDDRSLKPITEVGTTHLRCCLRERTRLPVAGMKHASMNFVVHTTVLQETFPFSRLVLH
ncbi:uncharacterized protein LOC112540783 [Python bivittatus]|uniref:Uncharacterized protein LOC112540783 n=1 Tax=Python bivittatus TaxID=176946 RepID=A0A9F5ILA3_PYTBI|nr:uncharacterized protein LOC112540783 [Python bivittatus]